MEDSTRKSEYSFADSRFSKRSLDDSKGKLSPSRSYVSPSRIQKSPLERIHQREINKIAELWEDTKSELKRTGEEIREIEEIQRGQFEKKEKELTEEVDRLKATVDQLRERLNLTELNLSRSRGEKSNMDSQLEETKEKLKKTESLLEVRSSMLRSKQQQLQELTDQVNNLSLEKAEELDRTQTEILEKESQLKSTSVKLALNESKLKQQEEDIKYLSQLNEKNTALIKELEELKEGTKGVHLFTADAKLDAERNKRELESTKEQLHILKSKKRYRLDIENRLDQLMKDNARLSRLLQVSGKFDDFLDYNQENEGIAYVGPVHESFTESTTYNSSSQRERSVNPKGEWKYWIPQDAYDLAKSFQNKHLPNVQDDLFSELLIKLNEIWHNRELKKFNQLKQRHTEALRDLRRQMSHRQHYEDVINTERVEHLKKELKKAQSPSRKLREVEGNMLDSTLVAVESLSRELTDLKKQNRDLKRTSIGSMDHDALFMEGAAWMGRKVVDLADKMGDKISSLALDFQQKIIIESSRASTSPQKLVIEQSRFFRSLERTVLSFRGKLRRLFEKVLQAIEEGQDTATLKLETVDEAEDMFAE